MPVHAVPGGWRWGTSGKVYKTKAEAERQARAIYASGYRQDAARRSRARVHLRASPRAEARYVTDLRRILRGVHEGTLDALGPVLDRWQGPARHDDRPGEPAGLITRVIAGLRVFVARHVGEAFDRMSSEVDKKNRQGAKLLGITPRGMGATDLLKRIREKNIALVEDAARDYAEDVRDILGDEKNFGLRVEDLRQKLVDRGNVSESRAELIARDQTLKTNAALTRDRHEKAGVTHFEWSTSHDERVRESHAELDGQVFAWDELPDVDGEEAYPGSPIQCRCVPVPVLD